MATPSLPEGPAPMTTGRSKKDVHIRDKIAMLSDNLVALNEGADTDKTARLGHLQTRMKSLDHTLTESMDRQEQRNLVLQEQLRESQKSLDNEVKLREEFTKAKEDDITRIENWLDTVLEKQHESNLTIRARILEEFKQKTEALKAEMESEERLRTDDEMRVLKHLEQDIPQLYTSLQAEVKQREEMEQRLIKRAMDEITQLQAAVLEEKKEREESEEVMIQMMEKIVTMCQSEVEVEKEEREKSEDIFLRMLAEASGRLKENIRRTKMAALDDGLTVRKSIASSATDSPKGGVLAFVSEEPEEG